MSKIIPITKGQYDSVLHVVATEFGAEGKIANTSYMNEAMEWVSVANGLVMGNESTLADTNRVQALIDGWNLLSMSVNGGNDSALVLPTGDYECHLWFDDGEGYEYQPNQDPFTSNDNTINGLTVTGKYLIVALNPNTMVSGYVEMEVN